MMKPTIYLPIEIKAREFSAKVLFARVAAEAGFRVYLGSKPGVDALVRRKSSRGGIYFYKGGKSADDIKLILRTTDAFCVLDEEMSPAVHNLDVIYKRRIYPGTEHLIRQLFVIGERHREVISRVRPELLDKAVVTGWPRVDSWKREFSGRYDSRAEGIRRRFGDFILFSSNFGVLTEERTERERQRIGRLRGLDPDNLPYYVRRMESTYREFSEFVDVVRVIDQDPLFPPLVIRPHPNEDISVWRSLLKNMSKVHIVYEDEVGPWLHAAKGLIHRGCTTALQAHIGGVPSVYILTASSEPLQDSVPYRVSMPAADYSELQAACLKMCAGEQLEGLEVDISHDVLDDAKLASQRIVDALHLLDVEKEASYHSPGLRRIFAYGVRAARSGASGVLRRQQNHKRQEKMPGGVKAAEVRRVAAEFFPGMDEGIVQQSFDVVEFDIK